MERFELDIEQSRHRRVSKSISARCAGKKKKNTEKLVYFVDFEL